MGTSPSLPPLLEPIGQATYAEQTLIWRTFGRSLHFNGPIIYLVAALEWADHNFSLLADFELVEFPLACLTMLNFLLLCVSKPF